MIDFPHIRYINDPYCKVDSVYLAHYLGGEPEENHSLLEVGKVYQISQVLYSPDKKTKRTKVWVVKVKEPRKDQNQSAIIEKYLRVQRSNFGTLEDLRDRKISQVI